MYRKKLRFSMGLLVIYTNITTDIFHFLKPTWWYIRYAGTWPCLRQECQSSTFPLILFALISIVSLRPWTMSTYKHILTTEDNY